jgi:hypothetical protein
MTKLQKFVHEAKKQEQIFGCQRGLAVVS